MTAREKIATYLRAILAAEDLAAAQREARLALEICERSQPRKRRTQE